MARTDGPSFRVEWSGDGQTISWEGRSLHMDDLRKLGSYCYDRAQHLLDKLMHSLDPDVDLRLRPQASLVVLVDRPNGVCVEDDTVTRALKQPIEEICGTSIGVQAYRQLSIAITERHVSQISRPFDIYDDKCINADLSVAFAWQSGHRPVQRGTNYGIDGAFPDSLQPALLRVYRWVSDQWQRFLGIDVAPADMRAWHTEVRSCAKRPADGPLPGHDQHRRRFADAASSAQQHSSYPMLTNVVPSIGDRCTATGANSPDRMSHQPQEMVPVSELEHTAEKLTPSNIDAHICYLPEFQIIVCRQHASAVQNLDRHLRDKHGVGSFERRQITDRYCYLPLKQPEDVVLPLRSRRPFRILGSPLTGLKCTHEGCPYITINLDTMRKHCKREYQTAWVGNTGQLYRQVLVQTFFRTGGLQRYFEVDVNKLGR